MMLTIGVFLLIANLICVKVNLDANSPLWMANAVAAIVVAIMVGDIITQL